MNIFFNFTLVHIMKTIVNCNSKNQVDLLVYNAQVYTVDETFSMEEAFAVKDGRFVAIGKTEYICSAYSSDIEVDMKGKPIYPGFHDAHCHFVCASMKPHWIDLGNAASYKEVIDFVAKHYEANPSFECIVGYGWNDKKWQEQGSISNLELNSKFPHIPVVIRRTCEHTLIANEEAIRQLKEKFAGIVFPTEEAPIDENGNFTGIFKEKTAERFWEIIPKPTKEDILKAATLCYQCGITSISDPGLLFGFSSSYIDFLDNLQQEKEERLSLRIDAWLKASEENFERFKKPYRTDRLTVGCVKLIMDGGLGAQSAWMLKPYEKEAENETDNYGIRNISNKDFLNHCQKAYKAGLQVATHCIGDAANREALDIYGRLLGSENDRRWRIEHAQIIAPEDFENFRKYSIVPSVQPTHATSDCPWAYKLIGVDRLRGAYAFLELKNQLGWLPFGTDHPVEPLNPIHTFIAAVFRKNLIFLPDGNCLMEPDDGFQMENAVSREDALRAMTIWAAKASFDEDKKGSIEIGKLADFVVLDTDIMVVSEKDIPKAKVKYTYISGECVYERK